MFTACSRWMNESERLEQRCYFTNRSDVDKRCARSQADFGFPTTGSQVVHGIRIEHAMLSAGSVNENSVRHDNGVVARLGHHAHGLVVHRMGWSCNG